MQEPQIGGTATSGQRGTDASRDRDPFIPVRKTDIVEALIERGPGVDAPARERLRQICRLLAAILHYEYFAQLERLRDDYFYFDPEIAPHGQFDSAAYERAYADLVQSFERMLGDANFVEISHAEIAQAHSERVLLPVEVEAPLDKYREVRFFGRGHRRKTVELSEWFGLRRRSFEVTVHDDVVLFVALKPEQARSGDAPPPAAHPRARAGSVLIKHFRDIASADLKALFPDVRVTMSLFDKLFLSGPALVGGVPILLKLASTITVLFLVIGFYLGLSASVKQDELTAAFAAVSGVVALGGFVMRQWLRFQNQSLKYRQALASNLYFHNITNQAGTFDAVVGDAEDQECKEAILAYCFLGNAAAAIAPAELAERIEGWLRRTFAAEVEFKTDDALARLDRLGVLVRDGERLSALSPQLALLQLDDAWASFFRPERAATAAKPETTAPVAG
jgi:hypothetical protein